MATAADPKTTPGLWTLLERRYEDTQGWLLFYEVSNATGFKGTGYADALAMSVWPSRGIQLLGFEIKRSRSDLIKELRDEQKAEKFIKYCHQWWLVVSDAKLTEGVEVPPNWGILAPRNQVLYQVRPAKALEPEPWKPEFIAAFMRRFHESHTKKDVKELHAAVEARAKELVKGNLEKASKADLTHARDEAERWKRMHADLQDRIKTFEDKSGLKVDTWNAGNIGELARAVQDGHEQIRIKNQLTTAKDAADRISKSMAGALKNLEQMGKPPSIK